LEKYPVEKISEHNGDPVVSIPVEMGGKIANYPFVLTKGKFEVVFNEHSDYVDIFESKIEDSPEEDDTPNVYSHAKKIIQRGEEIAKQNKFLNCEFFCNQMVGGADFKNNFSSQDVDIFDADEASTLLQTGDIIGFGGGEGQPPRHYAVYIIDGDVYEVEEVGASPRVSTVSDNLDTYEVISKIYRSKDDPDSIIYQDSVELGDLEDRKNDILLQIQEAKKNALIVAKKELETRKSRQIKQIRE
jgi:hypothetical protein